jgi:hypothetical protein
MLINGTLTSVAISGVAACAGATAAFPAVIEPAATPTAAAGDPAACMPEIYAYPSEASLARGLGQNGDVFSDALEDFASRCSNPLCLRTPAVSVSPVIHLQRVLAAKQSPIMASETHSLVSGPPERLLITTIAEAGV